MGDVFLGIQRGAVDFQRLIVLKRIHPHLLALKDQAQMFVDEASLVASLDHPHIVKIIDFRKAEDTFYIVMEYVDGETLKTIRTLCHQKDIPLPFPLACKLVLSACEALQYAHSATSRDGKHLNIIHRDIGLHNLMIDRNGYLKVIDFGIAKSTIQTDKTQPDLLKGNPSYMAPDIFLHERIDNRVDIYAMGLCLYELLTRRRAFNFGKGVQLAQVIQRVTRDDLPAPSSVSSSVPKELDEIVARSTAKDRKERYQSIADLSSDLMRVAKQYDKEYEQISAREWFYTNFSDRIQERIQFEQEVLALANSPSGAGKASICSYPPLPATGTTDWTHRPETSIRMFGSSKRTLLLIAGACAVLLTVAVWSGLALFRNGSNAAAAPEAPSQDSNLFIASTPPDATIIIDGKKVGKVDEDGITVHVSPEKNHFVTIRKEGYADYMVTIQIPKDGHRQIVASLTADEAPPTKAASQPVEEEEEGASATNASASDNASSSSKRLFRRFHKKKATASLDEEPEEAPPPAASPKKAAPEKKTAKSKVAVPLLETPGKKVSVPLLEQKPDNGVPMLQ